MCRHLDALLGGADAAGDEGAVFSRTLKQGQLSQTELTTLKSEDDHGVVQIGGRCVQVEFSQESAGNANGESSGSSGDGGGGETSSSGGTDSGGETSSSGNTGSSESTGSSPSECSAHGSCGTNDTNDPEVRAPSHTNGNSDSDKAGGAKGNGSTGDQSNTEGASAADGTSSDDDASSADETASTSAEASDTPVDGESGPEGRDTEISDLPETLTPSLFNPIDPVNVGERNLEEEIRDLHDSRSTSLATPEECMADCHSAGPLDPDRIDGTDQAMALTEGAISTTGISGVAVGVRDFFKEPSMATFSAAVVGVVPGVRFGKSLKSVGQLGREGEAAESAITGVGKNTQKFNVNGRVRIPDQVNAFDISTKNPNHVTEVKNVKSQSLTSQLRDDVDLVGEEGTVDVFVRPNTHLSGPLKRADADPFDPINIRPELK